MSQKPNDTSPLSPWWRQAVSLVMIFGFSLLTLDAWDFIRLKDQSSVDGKRPLANKQLWAIKFLIAVGVWNFVGAGVFGFLINLPITSFQEALPMPEKDRAMLPLIDIKDGTKLVLVALPKDGQVPPHQAPYPASAQLLQGKIEVLQGETWSSVAPGERVVFEQGQLHGVKALESSYLLVTRMRAQGKQ